MKGCSIRNKTLVKIFGGDNWLHLKFLVESKNKNIIQFQGLLLFLDTKCSCSTKRGRGKARKTGKK